MDDTQAPVQAKPVTRPEMNEYVDSLVGDVPAALHRYGIEVDNAKYRYGSKKFGTTDVEYIEFVVRLKPNVEIGIKLACQEVEACMSVEDKAETFLQLFHTIVQDVLARGLKHFQAQWLDLSEEEVVGEQEDNQNQSEDEPAPEVEAGGAVSEAE